MAGNSLAAAAAGKEPAAGRRSQWGGARRRGPRASASAPAAPLPAHAVQEQALRPGPFPGLGSLSPDVPLPERVAALPP